MTWVSVAISGILASKISSARLTISHANFDYLSSWFCEEAIESGAYCQVISIGTHRIEERSTVVPPNEIFSAPTEFFCS